MLALQINIRTMRLFYDSFNFLLLWGPKIIKDNTHLTVHFDSVFRPWENRSSDVMREKTE